MSCPVHSVWSYEVKKKKNYEIDFTIELNAMNNRRWIMLFIYCDYGVVIFIFILEMLCYYYQQFVGCTLFVISGFFS